MQIVDSLKNLVSGLGTAKDKTTALKFGLVVKEPAELNAMHRGDWLARKVVDIIPNDMTREWRNWQAEQDQIEKIEAVEQDPLVNLQAKVNRALQVARLLGGAVIYIGIKDAVPTEELKPDTVRAGDLKYLHVLGKQEVTCGETVLDVTSEFFGQPSYYEVPAADGSPVRIHPSRMVRFDGAPILDRRAVGNDTWGDSILQVLYDALQNAGSSQAHVAALIPEAKTDVVYMPNLSTYAATPAGQSKLTARFTYANSVKSMFNMLLLEGTGGSGGQGGTGEKWEQKQISFAQLPELIRQYLTIASGAADIPVTRLLGESPGGLNSTGEADLRNYYDNIAARQRIELSPALHRLDEVVIRSALGSRPDDVYYEWAPLWGMSEKEKAEVFKAKADAARALAGAKGGPLLPALALSDALVNTFTEDGSLPGLEAAISKHGPLVEKPEPEDVPGDENEDVAPPRKAANDAAPRTLYVSRKLINADEFIAWAKSQGFATTTPADELHVTITYSRTPVDWMKMGENWSSDQNGNVTIEPGGARLVEPLGDKGAIVLLFNSSALAWRHQSMREAGASWDFAEYQPHVTITYAGSAVDLSKVEPYRGRLVFGPEVFAELDEDWSSKITEDGGGRAAVRPFDTRRRKHGGHLGPRKGFDPNQPRGGDGRWIPMGRRLEAASAKAGKNEIVHVAFGTVRRPAELSRLVGEDVRGFRHAASNQAMRHALEQHGNAAKEAARGQKAISAQDFQRLPEIVRTGTYHPAEQRPFGPRRVEVRAQVGDDRYTYVAEVRRRQRRMDMVTMWKK